MSSRMDEEHIADAASPALSGDTCTAATPILMNDVILTPRGFMPSTNQLTSNLVGTADAFYRWRVRFRSSDAESADFQDFNENFKVRHDLYKHCIARLQRLGLSAQKMASQISYVFGQAIVTEKLEELRDVLEGVRDPASKLIVNLEELLHDIQGLHSHLSDPQLVTQAKSDPVAPFRLTLDSSTIAAGLGCLALVACASAVLPAIVALPAGAAGGALLSAHKGREGWEIVRKAAGMHESALADLQSPMEAVKELQQSLGEMIIALNEQISLWSNLETEIGVIVEVASIQQFTVIPTGSIIKIQHDWQDAALEYRILVNQARSSVKVLNVKPVHDPGRLEPSRRPFRAFPQTNCSGVVI